MFNILLQSEIIFINHHIYNFQDLNYIIDSYFDRRVDGATSVQNFKYGKGYKMEVSKSQRMGQEDTGNNLCGLSYLLQNLILPPLPFLTSKKDTTIFVYS